MRTIGKLFGRSPFVPLQAHMEKVGECVALLPALFGAYNRGNPEEVERLAKEVHRLEFQADQIKHDIRNSLPRGLFMPVDRANILEILSTQDSLADTCENVGVLLTFKQAKTLEPFQSQFDAFLAKNIEAFEGAKRIVNELDELLESGFGGSEAEKVRELVADVATREYEADLLQRDMIRELLQREEEFSYGDFWLWTRLIRQLSELSDDSENLAELIRTTLEK
jgi:predicted phosphate transport protein (TIGR00153 family)